MNTLALITGYAVWLFWTVFVVLVGIDVVGRYVRIRRANKRLERAIRSVAREHRDVEIEASPSLSYTRRLVDRLQDLPPALEDSDIVEIESNGTCRDPWREERAA